MVQSVIRIKEDPLENFPLQQVRILELINDCEIVLLAQGLHQLRIICDNSLIDISNHVIKGLNLAYILVELPSVKKLGNVFVKAAMQ